MPRRAVLCRAVLCRAVLCRAVLCRAVPCCAVLCCAVLCRAVLCRARALKPLATLPLYTSSLHLVTTLLRYSSTSHHTRQPVPAAVIEAARARAADVAARGVGTKPSQGSDWDRAVWGDEDCVVELLLCLWEAVALSRASGDAGLFGKMAFDKVRGSPRLPP